MDSPVNQVAKAPIDNPSTNLPAPSCRLCGGGTLARFTASVLGRHDVTYWHCEACGSLQTDLPYWLKEAYASVDLAADLGMAARTLQMAQRVSLALRFAGIDHQTRCLDYGGGNGLFCRMMRDQGFDFWNFDKYVTPFYCAGFAAERPTAPCAVVTSFEVFEHLAEPAREIDAIFGLAPDLWIFSTQLYSGQGVDWDYLARANGRHVFFYSARALASLAARRGYAFIPGRQVHAFIKKNGPRRAFARSAITQLLAGSRVLALAATLNFSWQQRYAFRRWQVDRERLRHDRRTHLPSD